MLVYSGSNALRFSMHTMAYVSSSTQPTMPARPATSPRACVCRRVMHMCILTCRAGSNALPVPEYNCRLVINVTRLFLLVHYSTTKYGELIQVRSFVSFSCVPGGSVRQSLLLGPLCRPTTGHLGALLSSNFRWPCPTPITMHCAADQAQQLQRGGRVPNTSEQPHTQSGTILIWWHWWQPWWACARVRSASVSHKPRVPQALAAPGRQACVLPELTGACGWACCAWACLQRDAHACFLFYCSCCCHSFLIPAQHVCWRPSSLSFFSFSFGHIVHMLLLRLLLPFICDCCSCKPT